MTTHSIKHATHKRRSANRPAAILKKQMPELTTRYQIKSLGIFGSYARNEHSKRSDLDILVEYSKTPNLFEFMDLEEYLTQLLKVKVDLVSRHALRGEIGQRILSQVVMI